ncbi:MAG TPA: argininosuccinate lyase [Candidatus Dormibacteraeota bacterium]|nr:argininosuccinate lyase [Candidatus Dormibacteraeota bacterium]
MAEPAGRRGRPAKVAPPVRLWGGRFSSGPARQVSDYTDSLAVDRRLYREDIAGSVAHARMLAAAGIITASEGRAIERGLGAVLKELAAGTFEFQPGDEDIHTAVERRLTEVTGADVGGKLHTGRSRNDQVALDTRLFARARIVALGEATCGLQAALLDQASAHLADIIPSYTHLQRAQPTTIGHHLLAYVAMLQRDFDRLRDAYVRADVMPLGSAAATGSSLPLRRDMVARELGFAAVSDNSLDAVSDRDFVVELESACALLMVHLSRLGEEWVLWCSQEFGFVELPDEYSTGSSLMPQKKNPDIAELMRGRTGRVIGDLVAMLTTLKGLPLAYNRDLQEDKQGMFDATDTALASLRIATELVARSKFQLERAAAAGSDPAMLATEVADYLVRKGIPFRRAHEVVGHAVRQAAAAGTSLSGLGLEQWQAIEPAFEAEGLAALNPARALASRTVPGSPGPHPLRRSVTRATAALQRSRRWLAARGEPGAA